MANDSTAPAPIYDRPDVRDALARGDWAVVLRAFLDQGLSQNAVAARTGLSQSQVSRLASGQSKTPGINTVKALCDGLGVPRLFAGLLDDASAEDDTERRQFLSGSLGVLATVAIPRSDLRDEQLLMITSLSYRQLEQRTPARNLVQPVTAHLALTCDIARRTAGKQHARLSAAVAEVAGLAAWLHADLAEPAQARRFYQMSMSAAQQAENRLLTVYMQGSFGRFVYWLVRPVACACSGMQRGACRVQRPIPPVPGSLRSKQSPSATSATATRSRHLMMPSGTRTPATAAIPCGRGSSAWTHPRSPATGQSPPPGSGSQGPQQRPSSRPKRPGARSRPRSWQLSTPGRSQPAATSTRHARSRSRPTTSGAITSRSASGKRSASSGPASTAGTGATSPLN